MFFCRHYRRRHFVMIVLEPEVAEVLFSDSESTAVAKCSDPDPNLFRI